uniref:Zgc:153759 n=1 Tax=Nothobranchius furzeri TaxID=105023 RepID=A0A8C6L8T9_NOTFU
MLDVLISSSVCSREGEFCPTGSRVKSDCTEDRSTSCLPCVAGTFMDKPTGQKMCFPCSVCDSGSGLKTKHSCSLASDTVCEPLEGFFCIDSTPGRCSAAQRHSRCEPGDFISKAGTSSSDAECSPCSRGTFSNGSSRLWKNHSCLLLQDTSQAVPPPPRRYADDILEIIPGGHGDTNRTPEQHPRHRQHNIHTRGRNRSRHGHENKQTERRDPECKRIQETSTRAHTHTRAHARTHTHTHTHTHTALTGKIDLALGTRLGSGVPLISSTLVVGQT